jgi:hypothetical protein
MDGQPAERETSSAVELLTPPRIPQESVMNISPRTTVSLRQRPLQFPAVNDHVELWEGLTERQQQECRQALGQMLVAVARHSRNAIDDHRGLLDQGPEILTHD